MFCGKCGKQSPEGYEFCMGCGSILEMDQQDLTISKQEGTIKTVKNKSYINIIVSVVSIILIAVCVFLGLKMFSRDQGYMRDTKWGMTVEQVMQSERSEPSSPLNEDGFLSYKVTDIEGAEGLSATLNYKFTNGRLTFAIAGITTDQVEKASIPIIKLYSEKYGDAIDYSQVTDSLEVHTWATQKSSIELSFFTTGLLMMSFTDINNKN